MKILYYLIQWTWGIPMNIVGLITFIVCKCLGYKSYMYRNAVCTEIRGSNFGGLEMGMFFLIGENCQGCSPHEYGHSIQNLWWGPIFPFVISIPSALRYWMRKQNNYDKKILFTEKFWFIGVLSCFTIWLIGFIFNILWMEVIAIIIDLYVCALYTWLKKVEIKKYKNNSLIEYDAIWFEGQATHLGKLANE